MKFNLDLGILKTTWSAKGPLPVFQIEDEGSHVTYTVFMKRKSFLEEVLKIVDNFKNLDNNWDDEGALKISKRTINFAKANIENIEGALKKLGLSLKEVFFCTGPVSDGRIDLELHFKEKELNLIYNGTNIRKVHFITYDNDLKKNALDEGEIDLTGIVSKLSWLIHE
jgi:hypothetical protein